MTVEITLNNRKKGIELLFSEVLAKREHYRLSELGFKQSFQNKQKWYAPDHPAYSNYATSLKEALLKSNPLIEVAMRPSFEPTDENISHNRFSYVTIFLKGREESFVLFDSYKKVATDIATTFGKKQYGTSFKEVAVYPRNYKRKARELLKEGRVITSAKKKLHNNALEEVKSTDKYTDENGDYTEESAGERYQEIKIPFPKEIEMEAAIKTVLAEDDLYRIGISFSRNFGTPYSATIPITQTGITYSDKLSAIKAGLLTLIEWFQRGLELKQVSEETKEFTFKAIGFAKKFFQREYTISIQDDTVPLEKAQSDRYANENGVYTKKLAGERYIEIEIPFPKSIKYRAAIKTALGEDRLYRSAYDVSKDFGDHRGQSNPVTQKGQTYSSWPNAIKAALVDLIEWLKHELNGTDEKTQTFTLKAIDFAKDFFEKEYSLFLAEQYIIGFGAVPYQASFHIEKDNSGFYFGVLHGKNFGNQLNVDFPAKDNPERFDSKAKAMNEALLTILFQITVWMDRADSQLDDEQQKKAHLIAAIHKIKAFAQAQKLKIDFSEYAPEEKNESSVESKEKTQKEISFPLFVKPNEIPNQKWKSCNDKNTKGETISYHCVNVSILGNGYQGWNYNPFYALQILLNRVGSLSAFIKLLEKETKEDWSWLKDDLGAELDLYTGKSRRESYYISIYAKISDLLDDLTATNFSQVRNLLEEFLPDSINGETVISLISNLEIESPSNDQDRTVDPPSRGKEMTLTEFVRLGEMGFDGYAGQTAPEIKASKKVLNRAIKLGYVQRTTPTSGKETKFESTKEALDLHPSVIFRNVYNNVPIGTVAPRKKPWRLTPPEYKIQEALKKRGDTSFLDVQDEIDHKEIVAKAINDGREVPEKVLDYYPDLKQTASPKEKEGLSSDIVVADLHDKYAKGERPTKGYIEKLGKRLGIKYRGLLWEAAELSWLLWYKQIYNNGFSFEMRLDQMIHFWNDLQPTYAYSDSSKEIYKQYSTPCPIGAIVSEYTKMPRAQRVFEPSAGNGLLVLGANPKNTHVNEIDQTRLDSLKFQGFHKITQHNAAQPFPDEMTKKYDVVVTNPPFARWEEDKFDKDLIARKYFNNQIGIAKHIRLEHLMCGLALHTLKDDGRAALIIMGHIYFGHDGLLAKYRPFFNWLFRHYYVDDIINMNSFKLYNKQGAIERTMLILIRGRKSEPHGVAPTKKQAPHLYDMVSSFTELWKRVSSHIDYNLNTVINQLNIALKK